MKNVTVSLDDECYRRARVRAAEAGRSLSSVVRDCLEEIGADKGKAEKSRLRELFARMDAEGGGLIASENLSRDEIYDERFDR